MPDLWMDVDTAVQVPVNILPLLDDTDFKTIETAIVYNSAGLAMTWNFVTCAGVMTQTAVTPTTASNHDWLEPTADRGMYGMEIPASGGTVNNDTEGFGWWTGVATGVLPFRGPVVGFRAAGLNDKIIESAYDATRGLAGTAMDEITAARLSELDAGTAGKMANDVTEILTDTGTTLDGRIPAALTANGNIKASLVEILTTALTETAGLLAGGFKKFFNVAAPTATCLSLPDAAPGAANGVFIAGSNAETSVTTALTANVTGNITGNLSGSVGSVTGAVGSVTGAVGSVTAGVTVTTNNDKTGYSLAAGQIVFKKNVARANFAFPMFDSTGALKTGLAVTAAIRKDAGAAFAALAGAVTEIGATGWYTVDWAQAETNADVIAFSASAAGANPTCYTILTQA